MRRTRRLRLDPGPGQEQMPDVGDVLVAPRTWYLIVDCWLARRYLHCMVEVYPKAEVVADETTGVISGVPMTDGQWWFLT